MAKSNKIIIPISDHKVISGSERKNKVEQGFFDGRFRQRRIKNKKKHNQKYQSRNKNIEESI